MENTNYTTEHRKGQHLLSEERHEIEVRLKDGWSVYRIKLFGYVGIHAARQGFDLAAYARPFQSIFDNGFVLGGQITAKHHVLGNRGCKETVVLEYRTEQIAVGG